jgi:hypothetical protein
VNTCVRRNHAIDAILKSVKKKDSYTYIHAQPGYHLYPYHSCDLLDIKQFLQLNDQLPLILANVVPEELLQRIDTLTANRRV